MLDLEERYKALEEETNKFLQKAEVNKRLRAERLNQIKKLEKEKNEKNDYIFKFRKAKSVIQRITDERNKESKEYIKKLVENLLATILQKKEYTMEITDDVRGGVKTTEIQLINTKTGKPRKVGTAVKQITSLLFILSLIEMSGSSKFMELDEYLSGASGEKAKKLSDVLVALSNNNKFQFFVVNQVTEISNNPEFIRIYLKKNSEGYLEIDEKETMKEKKAREIELENREI